MKFLYVSVFMIAIASVNTAPSVPTMVEVQVRRVVKRSTDGRSSFSVSVNGQGHNYKLALNPPTASVFSNNFKYNTAKEDEQGKVIFVDESPSEDYLREIEKQIFIDKESDSVLGVKNTVNGYVVHGIVNNLAIIPAKKRNQYQIIAVKSAPDFDSDKDNDYIDLHRNITHPKFSERAAISAQPEVWVIFDYDNSKQFDHDRTRILDYLGVFFHAINSRYATFANPSISFRISGVTTVSSRSAQPFLENNKVPDGTGNDINKVLEAFSTWASTNQGSGPKVDMAAVISGVDFQSKDSTGVYSKGVAGLAYLSAVCWKTSNRWYATSVTEDQGGYYDGVFSVAHEFAHNLGAPHDGSGDATSCSWDDGYIMSYKGWGGRNKFYFSSCSINLMVNYISSTQGSCVNSIQSNTNIPLSKDNVGDRYSMADLCIKYTKQPNAVPEPTKTPDELCKNLSCRYPASGQPQGTFYVVTLNHPPGENSTCGIRGGRCSNGNCVSPNG